ncbi:LytR family transcriptional attenuator [Actinoplanes teichomyceticus]|uniref:LytR family transcriptional attenuator n=2 Tax=Actinoplanes teichomyceticus TaxID=1867 RepID=A0A561W9G1_ACTTI|nr:LCP family protein [Actinoplanes teichomyceticus]TWG20494.1 LytR family transcriptional attenuator [Actinoplanes teichomyceticus]GIF14019.1 hypothetical protein Ate01nite_40510 [Actinoplanes teichomyceticus]
MNGFGHGRGPRWARLRVVLGSLLMIPALAAGPAVVPSVRAAAAAPISGALNILLVGIDPRNAHTAPLADSIIVAHVPADRSGAFLFSIPRDLVVPIPAFAESGSTAQRTKINAAMALGSRVGDREYRPAQGYQLLARTVAELTGIPRFDAGAILDFGGFTRLVDELGGLSVVVDQTVVSEHRKPDGTPRDRLSECPGHDDCHRPYTGPQKVYPTSDRPVPFTGWEALDYVRQRYGLPHSDYDRQRHQRQFVKALAKKLKRTVLTSPGRLPRLTGALGDSLTFVGGGHGLAGWAAHLDALHLSRMTTIGLPGSALFEDGVYRGEQFPAAVHDFFAAVAADRVAEFLLSHPAAVSIDAG